ncbi:MAG: hypothetical protein ACRYFR_04930 [Janthinobacterium lividum]
MQTASYSNALAAVAPAPLADGRRQQLLAQMAAGSPLLSRSQKEALATEAAAAAVVPATNKPGTLTAAHSARERHRTLLGQLAGVRRREQRLLVKIAEAEALAGHYADTPDRRRKRPTA